MDNKFLNFTIRFYIVLSTATYKRTFLVYNLLHKTVLGQLLLCANNIGAFNFYFETTCLSSILMLQFMIERSNIKTTILTIKL